jgi:molybdenum cofactor biosynthesis protein MoaC
MLAFAFEEIDDDLDLMPLAARRAADVSGLKPSLAAWRSLGLSDRRALCELGQRAGIDVAAARALLARAVPAPESMPGVEEPSAQSAPDSLLTALGPERPLSASVWSALSALERYALVKVALKGRPGRIVAAYSEIVGVSAEAPHLDARGAARMVSVSNKAPSARRAVARSRVSMNTEAFARLERADAPKGDVLGTARIAGIQGAKRASDLIPLCHPLSLTRVDVALSLEPLARAVDIRASVEAFDRTGVEMEALSAASAAALTVYDMLKAFDRAMQIGPTYLLEKSGGRSDYRREAGAANESRFALSGEPLDVNRALAAVARAEAGASVLFAGIVRDHNAGRSVTELEYEAYASMALKELTHIGEELERELPEVRVCALHRTGALRVGDTAVLCAASAPHRDEAFRAARLLIDRIKARVPIWKREHGNDGPYWVGWEDARTGSA